MVVFHSYSIAYQRVEKSRVDIIRDIFLVLLPAGMVRSWLLKHKPWKRRTVAFPFRLEMRAVRAARNSWIDTLGKTVEKTLDFIGVNFHGNYRNALVG